MLASRTKRQRMLIAAGASLAAVGLMAGCTAETGTSNTEPTNASVDGNAATGDTITIGFSGPAADHGCLDAFAFGDTAAASLGINVNATRWVLLTAVALLTGAMVSVSGAIGFVGLILPHVVRAVTGPGHRRLLPLVVVAGAIFLVIADTLARTVFDPRELPVGIVTAFIGVPVFIVLIKRKRSAAWA